LLRFFCLTGILERIILKTIPQSHQDLLRDETKAFAFLATLMPNGTPQVTPVWFSLDGDQIMINSAKGRTKDRNMRRRSEVALAIADPKNPYRYIQIRGIVVDITEEGGRAHINQLNKKYNGSDVYGGPASETRVIYRIRPIAVSSMG
jgi:PPOX class probable F420-dependent enzyme